MPTKRTLVLTLVTLILYFFANQTQIGWLYVMMAILAGIILTSGVLNRAILRGLTIDRTIHPTDELWEGDEVKITLTLTATGRFPRPQLILYEQCPLTDPDSDTAAQTFFLPQLPTTTPLTITYPATLYRRGLHQFPATHTESRAPFGFFKRTKTLPEPITRVLVYPEVKPLNRLTLLDRRPAVQQSQPRAGLGNEVLGVRPYRTGDSLRHIHWRSVARTGQLVTKEFVDETHPGLTLIFDNSSETFIPHGHIKHNPLETAVKIAASIGDYALRHGHPLYLHDPTMPTTPISADLLWQYLARLQPTNPKSLEQQLHHPPPTTFISVFLPYPCPNHIPPLLTLHQHQTQLLVILLDPQTFPNTQLPETQTQTATQIAATLTTAGITTHLINYQDNWREQLAQTEQTKPHSIRNPQSSPS